MLSLLSKVIPGTQMSVKVSPDYLYLLMHPLAMPAIELKLHVRYKAMKNIRRFIGRAILYILVSIRERAISTILRHIQFLYLKCKGFYSMSLSQIY